MQFVSILAISVLPGRTAEEQAFFPLLRLEILYEMRAPEWDPQPPFPRHRNRETLLFLCWHEKKLVHYGTFHPNYKTPTLPGTSTSTELCNKSICYFSGEKMSLEVERRDDRQPAKKKKIVCHVLGPFLKHKVLMLAWVMREEFELLQWMIQNSLKQALGAC